MKRRQQQKKLLNDPVEVSKIAVKKYDTLTALGMELGLKTMQAKIEDQLNGRLDEYKEILRIHEKKK